MAVKLGYKFRADVFSLAERMSALEVDGDLEREDLRKLLYALDAIDLRVRDLVYVVETYLDKEVG
jgi:hypothetical protein